MTIKETISNTVQRYVERYSDASATQEQKNEIAAAMISGMSLMANYLARNDGHADVTPAKMETVLAQVAIEMNLQLDQLSEE